MTIEPMETQPDASAPSWAQALTELELSLQQAVSAVASLRRGLEAIGFRLSPADALPQREAARSDVAKPASHETSADEEARPVGRRTTARPAPADADQTEDAPKGASFDRLWDKIERERTERVAPPEEVSNQKKGLDLLPQSYLMTVEDREGRVSLVPLHRGLQGLEGVEEVNLVSYANGVPVISLRSRATLDLDALGEVVGRVMDRECEVIQQDTGKLYLRMKAHTREGAI